jgi:hypothetical protein
VARAALVLLERVQIAGSEAQVFLRVQAALMAFANAQPAPPAAAGLPAVEESQS